MTTWLRRLLAIRIAARVNNALDRDHAYTGTFRCYQLFRDSPRTYVRTEDRILKLQCRVNRRLHTGRATVTKERNRLNVYATTESIPD